MTPLLRGSNISQSAALINQARQSLEEGDFSKAKEGYKQALRLSPRALSEITLDYERALERDNGNVALRLSLADFYLRIGETELALLELEEVLDLAPKTTQVYNILGHILLERGAISESIELLERAVRAGLSDISLTEMLAGAYLKDGDVERSIGLYKQMLGIEGANKSTIRILGDLYLRVGQVVRSAEMFMRLFSSDRETYKEVVKKLEDVLKISSGSDVIGEMLAEVYLKGNEPDLAVNLYKKIFSAERSKLTEAVSKYKEALELYPGYPPIICALAEALVSRGSYTEAAMEYGKLLKMAPSYINLAVQGYQNIIKKYPDNLLAHQLLGDAYNALQRFDEALFEYRRALSLDEGEADNIIKKCRDILKQRPDIPSLHQVLGDIYIIKKDFRKAVSEAEEALALDSQSIDAHVLMGDGYKGLGIHSKAVDSYRMALNLDPYNIKVHGKLNEGKLSELSESIKALKARIKEDQWRKSLHLDLAKLFIELRNWGAATLELQEALKDQARAPFVYNLLGISLKEQGRFELAASQFMKALESLPEELSDLDKAIRFNLASCYECLGQTSDAIAAYQAIREKDPEYGGVESKIKALVSLNPLSLRNKMFLLVLADLDGKDLIDVWGRDLRHVSHSRRGEEMGLSFAQTHNDKAFDYILKGLYRSAEEELMLASSLDARLPSALNNLAVIFAHSGKFDDALSKLSAALEEDAKSAVLHNNLGVINYLRGDLKGAEVEFLRAITLDSDLSPAQINLGDAYYSQGNARQAIASWEKVKDFSIVSELAGRRLRYKTPDNQ